MTEQSTRRKLEESEVVTLIGIAIIGLILVVIVARSAFSDDSATSPENPIKSAAIEEAKAMVTSKIISPATADFSPLSETEVIGPVSDSYLVSGWVDAQNTHGALIRKRYTASLKYDDTSGTWVRDHVTLGAWAEE